MSLPILIHPKKITSTKINIKNYYEFNNFDDFEQLPDNSNIKKDLNIYQNCSECHDIPNFP